MDRTALYEADFHAWSQEQARILRDLAQAGLRLPNDLDLEHVAEEIEDLGNEQRFAAESNLVQALIHLIKIVALPGDDAVRHWTKEANAFLDNAASRYRPSMRQAMDPAKLWARACRRAAQDLEVDGHAVPALPRGMPLDFEALMDGTADARDAAATLARAMAGEA
jgi:Domain of unknown function DUF29